MKEGKKERRRRKESLEGWGGVGRGERACDGQFLFLAVSFAVSFVVRVTRSYLSFWDQHSRHKAAICSGRRHNDQKLGDILHTTVKSHDPLPPIPPPRHSPPPPPPHSLTVFLKIHSLRCLFFSFLFLPFGVWLGFPFRCSSVRIRLALFWFVFFFLELFFSCFGFIMLCFFLFLFFFSCLILVFLSFRLAFSS